MKSFQVHLFPVLTLKFQVVFVMLLFCPNRSKFDPRATPYVFLDPKFVFLSRYVIFHETIFPFHSMDFHLQSHTPIPTSTLLPSPLPLILDSPDVGPVPLSTPSLPLDLFTTDFASSSIATLPPPSPPPQPHPIPSSRCSTRPHKAPAYHKDFHCQVVSITHTLPNFPIELVVSYDNLSSPHIAFTLALSIAINPKSYVEASRDPRWRYYKC